MAQQVVAALDEQTVPGTAAAGNIVPGLAEALAAILHRWAPSCRRRPKFRLGWPAVRRGAAGAGDPSCLKLYPERLPTHHEYAREMLMIRDFDDGDLAESVLAALHAALVVSLSNTDCRLMTNGGGIRASATSSRAQGQVSSVRPARRCGP
ncbi:hypothetical protein AB0I69_45540 [Streptomyces sp. NPDC050508]|uniref:hypothetical protein n=1 Tax=Streptomyces sp. NPDC050508 TaxID=3155405 RepID=UPI003436FE4B